MSARRVVVPSCIAALAACASFGANNSSATDTDDAGPDGPDATSSLTDSGVTDGRVSMDATLIPGLVPIVAYTTNEPTDGGEIIRAVTAEADRVFFSNSKLDTISELFGDIATTRFPGPGAGHQLITRGDLVWRTGVSATDDIRRYDTVGKIEVLVGNNIGGCAFVDPDGSKVYGVDYAGRILAMTANPAETDFAAIEVLNQTIDGGTLRMWGVAVTKDRIFYTRDENVILTRGRVGDGFGGVETVFLGGLVSPQCLTLDDKFMYFPTFKDGEIHRVDLTGEHHVLLARGQEHPTQIGISNGFLYWNSGNSVIKLAVPSQ